MTILITGAAGFIGNHLTRRLVQKGIPVRVFIHHTEKAQQRLGDVLDQVELYQGEINDRLALHKALRDVQEVVHLVAIPIERQGKTYEEINTQGTVNIVEAMKEVGVPRLLNLCQNGATPDHESPFLRSKGQAQEYVAQSGLEWITLRPSVAFGPEDVLFNSIAQLVRMFPVGVPLIGDGQARLQPVWVQDVVTAIERSLRNADLIGGEYELGGPEILTLETIYARIVEVMGEERKMVKTPVPLLRLPVWILSHATKGAPIDNVLLSQLGEGNVTRQNSITSTFGVQPAAAEGERIGYVREASFFEAVEQYMTGKPIERGS